MTDNELKELVAGLAVSQAKTDAQMAKTDAMFVETATQMKRTDETLARIGITLGNVTNNTGSITEEYFYNSMKAKPILGGVAYNKVDRNIKGNVPKVEDEFDIVMYNGDSIALKECKTKVHESDLRKLIEDKAKNFREIFPSYKDYKIYLGLASFSFYDDLEQMAKQNGVAILKHKGDLAVIDADNLKAY